MTKEGIREEKGGMDGWMEGGKDGGREINRRMS